MNDSTNEARGDKLTDDELDQVVGGTDGPGNPTDGTSAR